MLYYAKSFVVAVFMFMPPPELLCIPCAMLLLYLKVFIKTVLYDLTMLEKFWTAPSYSLKKRQFYCHRYCIRNESISSHIPCCLKSGVRTQGHSCYNTPEADKISGLSSEASRMLVVILTSTLSQLAPGRSSSSCHQASATRLECSCAVCLLSTSPGSFTSTHCCVPASHTKLAIGSQKTDHKTFIEPTTMHLA